MISWIGLSRRAKRLIGHDYECNGETIQAQGPLCVIWKRLQVLRLDERVLAPSASHGRGVDPHEPVQRVETIVAGWRKGIMDLGCGPSWRLGVDRCG